MRHLLTIPRTAAWAVATTLGAGVAQQPTFARATHATHATHATYATYATYAVCAAAGIYVVGQPLRSIQPEHPRTGAYREENARVQGLPAFVVVGMPRGTLDVLSYARCGQPTRGTFSVQFGIVTPLSNQRKGYGAPMTTPARVETLSGTFSATGTSAAISSTVAVKGVLTVQSAQPGPHAAVTSTAIDVTGSLEIMSNDHVAILTFARPDGASRASADMVIYGHRGSYLPVTE